MDSLIKYLTDLKKKLTLDNLMVRVVGRDRSIMDLIVKLNTENQLFKGIRSDGTEITPPYTGYTISIKTEKNQPTDRVTLKDTGDFYESFVAYVDGSKDIIITSNPIKVDEFGFTTNLIEKYGDKIEGLTEESKVILNSKLIVPIEKYIKEVIFKI